MTQPAPPRMPADPQGDPTEAPDDPILRRVELIISRLLRVGVLASLALLIAGTLVSFVHGHRYGSTPADVAPLIGAAGEFPRTLGWLGTGLRELRGQALIVLGLLILITTPILRVAVSIAAFAIERDRAFVIITSTVLALLVLSFVLGHAAG